MSNYVVWGGGDSNENELLYDYEAIGRAATAHNIASSDLMEYAFQSVTDTVTAEQLVSAYLAHLESYLD